MKALSLKLPDRLCARLDRRAKRHKQSKSQVIRDALDLYLDNDRVMPQRGSVLEVAGDLVGCVEGPEDLATHPKYMEGFGAGSQAYWVDVHLVVPECLYRESMACRINVLWIPVTAAVPPFAGMTTLCGLFLSPAPLYQSLTPSDLVISTGGRDLVSAPRAP